MQVRQDDDGKTEQSVQSVFTELIDKIKEYHKFSEFVAPVAWSRDNINFKHSVSATIERLDLTVSPYLIEPIMMWDFKGYIREMTVVAPEQTGKTLVWVIGLLWSMIFEPCLSIVCYPSEEKAIQCNQEKMIPLMRAIPHLKNELDNPRSFKKDCYNFSNLKSYFMGAGSRVTSQSARIRIADEVDDWVVHEGQVTNIQDLRKRARSFKDSMLCMVCSPTKTTGTVWTEFEKSSQGYWYLGCLGCNNLTMRSCDIHNMQFESSEGEVNRESIRLVCPQCKKEHVESDKYEMNKHGGYIHEYTDRRKTHPGFQWGALACQWDALNWGVIADAQLLSGKSGNLDDVIYFDNSIRGLPYKRRRSTDTQINAIKKHRINYSEGLNLLYRLMACDTQDDSVYWIVRGVDEKENTYLLEYGRARTLDELDAVWDKEFYGDKLKAAIIDAKGHRTPEIKEFTRLKKGFFMYMGDGGRLGARYKVNPENPKILRANSRIYQAELLHKIYTARKADNFQWLLPHDVDDKYLEQITDMKSNNSVKHGDEYENWTGSGNDHWFDCEKEFLVLNEHLKTIIKQQNKKKPVLMKSTGNNGGFINGWNK